jgi:predicted PurR-regulated permease PerM
VIAVALVPVLEWFERRRVPSTLAALTCVILFLAAANLAIAAILLPAVEWVHLAAGAYRTGEDGAGPGARSLHQSGAVHRPDAVEFGQTAGQAARTVRVEMPNSSLDLSRPPRPTPPFRPSSRCW